MAQKYNNVAEAAKTLGIAEADVRLMLERKELYGYRDGTDWKFKAEDIERLAAERASEGHGADHDAQYDDGGDVLASEIELGHSDPGLSGTVIGVDKNSLPSDSDIRLAGSDIKLPASKTSDSDLNFDLMESGIDLAGEKKPAAPAAKGGSPRVSQFDDLDMTLDHDLSLEESNLASSPVKPAVKPGAKAGDSAIDLSGKHLDDDDLVLGGSGTGSDISIGGDSGISLADPVDSGISLEAPLNLSSDESLELGEDDLLSGEGAAGLKSEDDFQLTPMEDLADFDDSESGSQVIALDTESEGDEAATMVASGPRVAGLLDDDMGGDHAGMGLAAMPLATAGATELGLAGPGDGMGVAGFAGAAALPEAPYSIWNIVSLVLCSLILIFVGMMMYELLQNMWSWDRVTPVNGWLMDTIVGLFEKP